LSSAFAGAISSEISAKRQLLLSLIARLLLLCSGIARSGSGLIAVMLDISLMRPFSKRLRQGVSTGQSEAISSAAITRLKARRRRGEVRTRRIC